MLNMAISRIYIRAILLPQGSDAILRPFWASTSTITRLLHTTFCQLRSKAFIRGTNFLLEVYVLEKKSKCASTVILML